MKQTILFILFFLVFSLSGYSLVLEGRDTSGNVYSSDNTAQGSIVEKDVLSGNNAYNSTIFSWGAPLGNATSEASLSASWFGISSSGDVYVMTIGPELEESVASVTPVTVPETVSEGSGVPSSGTGGGGGSSHHDTYGLIVGDIVTVLINSIPHEIEITSIKEQSAVLTVDNIYIITLELKETVKIDVDNDGIEDMSITLDSLSDLREITITVEDMTYMQEESITQEAEMPEPLERITAAVSALPAQDIAEAGFTVGKKTGVFLTYLIGLNLVVGLLVASVVATKRLQQRRIYTVFHAQSQEQLIQQELAKLQHYVSASMDAGKSVASIKRELLTAGWHEYEIDSMMVDAMLKEEEFFNRIR